MLFFSLFIVASIAVLLTRNKDHKTKLYALLGLSFIVFYTFRSYSVGLNDIEDVYLLRFNHLSTISLKYILTHDLGSAFGSTLWSVFTKISFLLNNDFRYFLFINSVIVVTSTFIFIGQKSNHWFLSVFVFAMVYFQYSVYLLRHFISLSCILLFLSAENSRLLKWGFAILSVAFHTTALVFYVTYYGLLYINKKWFLRICVLAASMIILYYGNELVAIVLPIISQTYFDLWSASVYSRGNVSAVMVVFFLLCGLPLIAQKTISQIDKLFLFSIPILLSMGISEDFYRISFFLSEPYMLLLFDKIAVVRVKPKWIMRGFYYMLLVTFFIYMGVGNNVIPYQFG